MIVYHWSKAYGHPQENYCFAHFFPPESNPSFRAGNSNFTPLVYKQLSHHRCFLRVSIQHCTLLFEHSTINKYIVSVSIRNIKARPMSGSGANTPAHTASHMPHLCNILLMWRAWIRYWCRSCAEYSVGLGFRFDGMCFPFPLTVIPTFILRLGQLEIRGRKVVCFLKMFSNNIWWDCNQ